MKQSDFDMIKPGMKIYRTMDIGRVTREIEDKFISAMGFKFVKLVGDKTPRNWNGLYKFFNISEKE